MQDGELREKLRDSLKEMKNELGGRITGKGPLFPKGDWGVRAFTWGIVCLVISLLLLATILLTR